MFWCFHFALVTCGDFKILCELCSIHFLVSSPGALSFLLQLNGGFLWRHSASSFQLCRPGPVLRTCYSVQPVCEIKQCSDVMGVETILWQNKLWSKNLASTSSAIQPTTRDSSCHVAWIHHNEAALNTAYFVATVTHIDPNAVPPGGDASLL